MLKLASYDIVFTEIPGEVTLALNLSGCPNRCEGCHSPHLREDIGEPLTDGLLEGLLETYGGSVTCVAFMGGDGDVPEVERLARSVRGHGLKTAWYSGREKMPKEDVFDYVKLGPYIASLGGLDSPTTNQRLYRIVDGRTEDITASMRKK
jgi:anaerobic ribonucleoside-triphosphate reductase activating protein